MATGSGVSGPREVIGVMEDIGVREVMGVIEVIGVIEVMGIIDVIGVMEVIWVMVGFMGLEVIGFEAMGFVVMEGVTDAMLPMEGLEFPIGWRGSPPFAGSSTISRRL